jgi:hypothetical protein
VTNRNAALREMVSAAVREEVDRVGRGAFRRITIIAVFEDHGVSRATIGRWIRELLGSGAGEIGRLKHQPDLPRMPDTGIRENEISIAWPRV